MSSVQRWTSIELTFESSRSYADPFWDLDVAVELTSPSGRRSSVDAFWDGGQSWLARIRPDEVGGWTWRVVASPPDDGLHGRAGEFTCEAYEGPNPVYRHGPVEVAEGGRTFAHADGTPFLWLGDTVWNGAFRSDPADWLSYLETRRAQGFSVIQFFSTLWRGLPVDPFGEVSFDETGRTSVNPAFFKRLDGKVKAIADQGLLGYVIVVLALHDDEPGWAWPAERLVRFTRWLRARWGAYHVAWSMAADGHFTGARTTERFNPIGRAVFDPPEALVTMHPVGWTWSGDEFRDEPWLTFLTYQASHSDADDRMRWLAMGPPSAHWDETPAKPIINIEPNYENSPAYVSRIRFTAHDVRRQLYWSLFVTPTAGVSYGHFSLWAWAAERELVGKAWAPHADVVLEPWYAVLDTPGAVSVSIIRRYLETGRWWDLQPAQELLLEQPGLDDVLSFIAVARTTDGSWTVAYTASGNQIVLEEAALAGRSARWFDPRTGNWQAAFPAEVQAGRATFLPPGPEDWLLDLRT